MHRISAVLFLLFLLTEAVLAHGTRYFEFAPDISNPHPVALYQTPAQQFYPPNDFLDGVDLWIDNDGSPGTATFELRNSANALLATRTVTVPSIAPAFGGTRFHIDLGSLVQVSNNSLYTLRIISSLPKLNLYQANLLQVLQHNAQYYSDYVVEPALLGSSPQSFAFKFALYEGKETAPPLISNIKASVLSPTSARLDWNANEPSDGRIDAVPQSGGNTLTSGFSNAYTYCPTQGTATCNAAISGLSPNTAYNYTLTVQDSWGNQATANGAFTTPAGPTPSPSAQSPTATPATTSSPAPSTSPGQAPSPSPTATQPSGTPSLSASPTQAAGVTPPPQNTQSPPPAANTPQTSNPAQSSGSGGGAPVQITIADSDGSDSDYTPVLIIEFTAPETGRPITGYKIEIISEETGEVERELIVSGDTRKLVLEKLAPGRYLLRVFALKNGAFEQLGEPTPFIISVTPPPKPFGIKAIAIAILLIVLAIAVISAILRVSRK